MKQFFWGNNGVQIGVIYGETTINMSDDDLAQKQRELAREQAELGRKQAELGRKQAEIGRLQAARAREQVREAVKNMKNSSGENKQRDCGTCAWAEVKKGPFRERDEDNTVIICTGVQTTCKCPYPKSLNIDDGVSWCTQYKEEEHE